MGVNGVKTQALDNPLHEKYCQLVVSGLRKLKAYETVYGLGEGSVATRRQHAKTLARRPEVETRISQLRRPVIEHVRAKFQCTLDDLLDECVTANNLAAACCEPSTMLRATELKAKLLKMLGGETKRSDRELDGVSVEELLDLLTELRVRKQELIAADKLLVSGPAVLLEAGADLV